LTKNGDLYRIAAFAKTRLGGNPAGVWVGEELPEPTIMQQIAAEVGFSETAFVAPASGIERTVRYFSPEAEVTFCGHATIAASSVLGSAGEETTYQFSTLAGEIAVTVRMKSGQAEVSFASVATKHKPAKDSLVDEALTLLGWNKDDLDDSIPPAVAYAGAWHLVLAVSNADRLRDLDYDFAGLKRLMLDENITTLQLVWREHGHLFHARNPFPVGGVVEDPATGAAAAALGGYLRDAGITAAPVTFEIRQGEAMGRPSFLTVEVPKFGGVLVSGSAIRM